MTVSLSAAVISLESVSSKWIVKALKGYMKVVDSLHIRDIEVTLSTKGKGILYKGKPIDEYDCILVRGSFRYAPLLRAITTIASKNSYMPLSSSSFTIIHDKLLTQLELQRHNIPMPQTYLTSTPEAGKKLLARVNYPIIMKFPSGTQGKGVMFADSYAGASSMLDALIALKQPFLIQEYVETGGVDIRALVVGDKVAAAMKRKAVVGEKRANIHAGGIGEACTLSPAIQKIAVDTAKALGAEIIGVDILENVKGPVVIEANISPGLQGITKATKIDVADKIAKYLYEKTKEFKQSKEKKETKEMMEEITPAEGRKEIISNLDFRGNRILLPEMITKVGKFSEEDDFVIKVDKGKLVIEKMHIVKKK
jgi:ribosomal protein S6--L-glutamate ligase